MLTKPKFYFEADKGGAGGTLNQAGDPPKSEDPKKWEDWLATQPESVQKLFEEHVGGLKSALTSEREKAKNASTQAKRLAELEDAEKKRKDAELSDAQKAQERLTKIESEKNQLAKDLETERIRNAVMLAASSTFQDPEDAYLLIDLSVVEITKDGKVTGVEDALKALLKKKPHLAKLAGGAQSPDIDAVRRGNGSGAITNEEAINRKRRDGKYAGL